MARRSELTVQTVNGITVIGLAGTFDHHQADRLKDALTRGLAENPQLVCDLTRTTALDPLNLGVLVMAATTAARAGGWVRLAGPRRDALRILRVTQLDRVLGVFPDLASAMTAGAEGPYVPADAAPWASEGPGRSRAARPGRTPDSAGRRRTPRRSVPEPRPPEDEGP